MLLPSDNALLRAAHLNERGPQAILALVDFALVYVGTELLGSLLLFLLGQDGYVSFSLIWLAGRFALIIAGVCAWVHFLEKRPLAGLGLGGPGRLGRYALGFLLGLGMMAALVSVSLISGVGRMEPAPLVLRGLRVLPPILVMLPGWIIQSAAEEILVRGWLLPRLGLRLGLPGAVFLSSLIFSLMHGLNTGVSLLCLVNLMLFGGFLGLMALHQESLLGVCGWHAAWNFSQGNLFGYSVSGYTNQGGSLMRFSVQNPLWGGGAFGPEGGLLVTLGLLLGVALLLLLMARKGRRRGIEQGGGPCVISS